MRKSIFDRKSVVPGPGEYDVIGDFGGITLRQTTDVSNTNRSKISRPQTARNWFIFSYLPTCLKIKLKQSQW